MSAIPIRMNFVTGTDKREKRHVRGFRSLLASHRNIKVPEYRLRCNPSPEKVRPFYSPIYIYRIYNGKFISVSIPFTFSLINRDRACVTDKKSTKSRFFSRFHSMKIEGKRVIFVKFSRNFMPSSPRRERGMFVRSCTGIYHSWNIFFRDDRTRVRSLKFPSFRSIFHSFRSTRSQLVSRSWYFTVNLCG